MSHLAPCPACNRHVDLAETACPFCAAALAESFRGQPQTVAPPRRLSRAALMAAGATLMGAAACRSNDAITGGKDAATDRRPVFYDGPVGVPIYGAPFTGTGGISGAGGITGTGGAVSTGGTDAGNDGATDAAPARDAAQERSIIAIYGAAFAGGLTSDKPQS
jgi:hypothetical protein